MPKETIYYIYWEGPFDWDQHNKHITKSHVLYQIYGAHPLYGRDVLLYIGLTSRGINTRLKEHEWWVGDASDKVTVRFGTVGKFTSWPGWERDEFSSKAKTETVEKIEALLIYANQPAFNTSNKKSVAKAKGMRVFNTGKMGQILPEASYTYYWGQ